MLLVKPLGYEAEGLFFCLRWDGGQAGGRFFGLGLSMWRPLTHPTRDWEQNVLPQWASVWIGFLNWRCKL
ncbi:MAG: hypothetical protein DRR16_22840 [Candidatus Parabeggiatoa sp. nov. 3]|nr:MAG: hypothetical protein DRR00_26215 [Gammaproteobacteria bacterium]RKZ60339.1 MAG: hypothetical protein DRQ99_22225 [Gammaproteobacteria bacterium]RKZ81019.1 MAG: hypothetical protein DRR16_22840 [Gammaproteobacteria bacterium]